MSMVVTRLFFKWGKNT